MVAWDVHGDPTRPAPSTRSPCCARPIRPQSCASASTRRCACSELIADGILVATPAGSTAYNLSVNGPILPLNAPLLALTPISAFRPRRWRGALLPDYAKIEIEVLEPEQPPRERGRRPHGIPRRVERVQCGMDRSVDLVMLHDPGHSLDERILREQFGH